MSFNFIPLQRKLQPSEYTHDKLLNKLTIFTTSHNDTVNRLLNSCGIDVRVKKSLDDLPGDKYSQLRQIYSVVQGNYTSITRQVQECLRINNPAKFIECIGNLRNLLSIAIKNEALLLQAAEPLCEEQRLVEVINQLIARGQVVQDQSNIQKMLQLVFQLDVESSNTLKALEKECGQQITQILTNDASGVVDEELRNMFEDLFTSRKDVRKKLNACKDKVLQNENDDCPEEAVRLFEDQRVKEEQFRQKIKEMCAGIQVPTDVDASSVSARIAKLAERYRETLLDVLALGIIYIWQYTSSNNLYSLATGMMLSALIVYRIYTTTKKKSDLILSIWNTVSSVISKVFGGFGSLFTVMLRLKKLYAVVFLLLSITSLSYYSINHYTMLSNRNVKSIITANIVSVKQKMISLAYNDGVDSADIVQEDNNNIVMLQDTRLVVTQDEIVAKRFEYIVEQLSVESQKMIREFKLGYDYEDVTSEITFELLRFFVAYDTFVKDTNAINDAVQAVSTTRSLAGGVEAVADAFTSGQTKDVTSYFTNVVSVSKTNDRIVDYVARQLSKASKITSSQQKDIIAYTSFKEKILNYASNSYIMTFIKAHDIVENTKSRAIEEGTTFLVNTVQDTSEYLYGPSSLQLELEAAIQDVEDETPRIGYAKDEQE